MNTFSFILYSLTFICSSVAGFSIASELPASIFDNTLAGTDLNTNGIRDDIDALIESDFTPKSLERNWALRYAANLQFALTYQDNNVSEGAMNRVFENGVILYCSASTQPDALLEDKFRTIKMRTINNEARAKQYEQYNRLFSGRILDNRENSLTYVKSICSGEKQF